MFYKDMPYRAHQGKGAQSIRQQQHTGPPEYPRHADYTPTNAKHATHLTAGHVPTAWTKQDLEARSHEDRSAKKGHADKSTSPQDGPGAQQQHETQGPQQAENQQGRNRAQQRAQ